jgi:hypothetical protein
MIAAISTALTWNLIVICLVWLTGIIIIQLIKFALLNSIKVMTTDKTAENNTALTAKIANQRIKVKQGAKIFSSLITVAAVITLLVFALFMNNNKVKPTSETNKIKQAPLPKNFTPMTTTEIKQTNVQAVTQKSKILQQKATQANTNAMNDGINIFKKAK